MNLVSSWGLASFVPNTFQVPCFFASPIPLRQAPITHISIINSTKHGVVRVGLLTSWHYKDRPHVISLMKKHENNFYSFKKFPAIFLVEFRSLGRPEEQLEHTTSWLLFHHILGVPSIWLLAGSSVEVPQPTGDWFSFYDIFSKYICSI